MFRQRFKSLCLVLLFFASEFSWAQQEVSSSTMKESFAKSYEELYSESSYYEQYNLVTDTRLRHYQPLQKKDLWEIDAYIGANLQYQSAGAPQKYFDDSINPYVGLQGSLWRKIFLQLQAGARSVLNQESQGNSTQWDPRVILSAGDFWTWTRPQIFTEAYGEVAYVPRLDATPVSTGWIKQGYRFKPLTNLNIDPYAELYARESRSADLGPTMNDFRLGFRTQWLSSGWNVAALLYHPFNRHEARGDVEGLLVIGGVF